MTAIRAVLVLCLLRLGAHLVLVAVVIGAVLGAMAALVKGLRACVLAVTLSAGILAAAGVVTAIAGIASA